MNIQDWFPLGWTGWISLQFMELFKSLLQHHGSKALILWCSAFFIAQLSHPYPEKFSTVCCDPLSQRFWHSQWSSGRIFLELSCFFDGPTDVGNLISGSSAFSISSLNIWKFSVHILLKPHLENFEHYFASVWNECNCAVVWTSFGIAFLWGWNENPCT